MDAAKRWRATTGAQSARRSSQFTDRCLPPPKAGSRRLRNNTMRILYLTPYVPSPVRVRPYQLIRHLAELGHDVTLICLAGKNEEPAALQALRRWCREVVVMPTSGSRAALQALRALPTARPLQVAYGASDELVAAALQRASHHDVVHIEHL